LCRSVSVMFCFFFSSRRRHTRFKCDWSSDVCSSDLATMPREGHASIYIDGRKLSNEVRVYLEPLANVREPGAFADDLKALGATKIGRASCRERVETAGVVGAAERKVRIRRWCM